MAIVSFPKCPVGIGFEYSETIANGANGNTLLIPKVSGKEKVTCTLIAESNTGKIQVTTSPVANVMAGTETWQDWGGVTTGIGSDVIISAVTAVRGVSTSGEVKVEFVY